jgi:hypothetical protein
MSGLVVLVLIVLLAFSSISLLLAGAFPASRTAATHATGALLADLGMAPLGNFHIERRPRGGKWLRFDAVIVNVGDGPFQALGHTRQSNGELLVDQQIRNSDGTWASQPTAYRMYWSGDGHNHWHVRDLEGYVLQNTAATVKRTGAKHGFCFFDNYEYALALPDAPGSPQYTRCGFGASDASVTMGLSIGWGDLYNWNLPDQYIDITNLPAGEYTLTATADVQGFFAESNETNNSTTATIRLTKNGVSIVDPGTGP